MGRQNNGEFTTWSKNRREYSAAEGAAQHNGRKHSRSLQTRKQGRASAAMKSSVATPEQRQVGRAGGVFKTAAV